MYERFTDRSRKVMQLANQAAIKLHDTYIGSEHILLALAKEGSGVGSHVLDHGVSGEAITIEIGKFTARDHGNPTRILLSPQAKKVVEYAMDEARNLGHQYVGTEHLLLGLLRYDTGIAANVLTNLGLDLEGVRMEVIELLGGPYAEGTGVGPPQPRFELNPPPWSSPQLDEDTKSRVRQSAEMILSLQVAKEEAVAAMDFQKAAELRDRQDQIRKQLCKLILPDHVLSNVRRLVRGSVLHLPVLDTLYRDAGEADPRFLSLLPKPVNPPLRVAVAFVPQNPVGTVRAALPPDDIGSLYFQAPIVLISPESISPFKKDLNLLIRAAFRELNRATTSYAYHAIICVVRPTALPEDVKKELFDSIAQTNGCEFVVFAEPHEVQEALHYLPAATKLLESPTLA